MQKYDIVEDATTVVENELELLHALYEAKQAMAAGQSRRVCRCGPCRSHRATTLAWLSSLRDEDEDEDADDEPAPAEAPVVTDASRPLD